MTLLRVRLVFSEGAGSLGDLYLPGSPLQLGSNRTFFFEATEGLSVGSQQGLPAPPGFHFVQRLRGFALRLHLVLQSV